MMSPVPVWNKLVGSHMNYTARKVFVVVLCSFFALMGILSLLFARKFLDPMLPAFIGVMFILSGVYVMRTQLQLLSRFEKNTYSRYKDDHPEHVRGNRVSCCECGSSRISARGLMNHTYHREHYCMECGKTLYYSPEQS